MSSSPVTPVRREAIQGGERRRGWSRGDFYLLPAVGSALPHVLGLQHLQGANRNLWPFLGELLI
jgi:hypothetical protein